MLQKHTHSHNFLPYKWFLKGEKSKTLKVKKKLSKKLGGSWVQLTLKSPEQVNHWPPQKNLVFARCHWSTSFFFCRAAWCLTIPMASWRLSIKGQLQHIRTWLSEHGGDERTVGLDDLNNLFWEQHFVVVKHQLRRNHKICQYSLPVNANHRTCTCTKAP